MSSEDLYNSLLNLVEKSEARIDKTNGMIQNLTETCRGNMEMYDRHLTSLETSRDTAQKNAARSIEVTKELTELIARLRDDYQAQLGVLKGELHTLRDEYRKEMNEMRRDYKELSASYRRLAEKGLGGGSRSEVKITR